MNCQILGFVAIQQLILSDA